MTIIPLGPALLTSSSDLPGSFGRAVLGASLFGLAPCGVLPAIFLTADAVRSYRTFSPLLAFALRASAKQAVASVLAEFESLPRRSPKDEGGRYVFCATFLQVALTGRYPAHCPAEFGLSSRVAVLRTAATSGRLAHCDHHIVL